MTAPVFIGSGFVAKYPEGGGNAWVPLQYLFGFRDQGVEAYWLELLPGSGDAARDQGRINMFLARARRLGIADRALLLHLPDGRDGERQRLVSAAGLRPAAFAALARDGILLNFANSIPQQCRGGYALEVLYDIDPGMLQLWSRQWDMGVDSHDLHVTIGQSIGRPECPVPDNGVRWQPIWPTVHLPSWPAQTAPGARYTTITQWWNGNSGYDLIDGELYEHNKRASFLACLDVPERSGLELELAANLTPDETEDREALRRHGWRLVQPHEVAGTPWAYRRYVQASRGEFSCAKPSVIKASPGWISDRTLCYLASGRPCVVQAAGAERHLPKTLGLQFFDTSEEAAEALRAVEGDYARACREARALAEEFFATRVVVPQILKAIGLEPARRVRRRPQAAADAREAAENNASAGEMAVAGPDSRSR